MDLGVPLESPQGSQASSPVVTWKSAFLPSFSSSVSLPVELTQGSVAFLRGFPTGLSHVPSCCESILGVTVETVLGNQVYLEWIGTLGSFVMVARPLAFLLTFEVRPPPLEVQPECRDCFPDKAGKWTLISR